MGNPLVVQIGAAVLVLLFFVALYLSSQTWRWHHMTALAFVFLGSVGFIVLASLSFRTHAAWRTTHGDLEDRLAQTEDEQEKLLYGDLDQPPEPAPLWWEELQETNAEAAAVDESLRSVKSRLERELIDRGRVWRNAEHEGFNNGALTVNTAPDDLLPDDPIPPSGITPGLAVHVFFESSPGGDAPAMRVPAGYVGEFEVTDVTETTATLRPLSPQVAGHPALQDSGGAFSIYEVLPVDAHGAFAGMSDEEIRSEFQRFNRLADMPQPMRERLDQIIEQYVRNGEPAEESDPPEHVWYQVTFKEEVTVPVDSAAGQAITEDDGSLFDTQGQAVVGALQRTEGDEVTLEVGEEALMPSWVFEPNPETNAAPAIDPAAVEIAEKIYIRPLNDYSTALQTSRAGIERAVAEAEQVQREMDALQAADQNVQNEIARREQRQTKLESDIAGFQKEIDALDAKLQDLEQHRTQLRKDLSDLYRKNLAIARRIEQRQQEWTEQIEQREQEASQSVAANDT